MNELIKSGPSTVPMMNHFERTRSRYSRLITSSSLFIRLPYFLNEDLVKGRLNQLEAADARTGVERALEQLLRIRAVRERHFYVAGKPVDAFHQTILTEKIIAAFISERNLIGGK